MDQKQRYYDQNRKRAYCIRVRCTEEEKELIRNKANSANMNLNRYMLYAAMNHKIIIKDMKPVLDMNYEINQIGNNINQIAHKVNTYDIAAQEEISLVKKQLQDLIEEYRRFLKNFNEL